MKPTKEFIKWLEINRQAVDYDFAWLTTNFADFVNKAHRDECYMVYAEELYYEEMEKNSR